MNDKMKYTYSAPTEEEKMYIKSVRSKYVKEEETPLDRLTRLDKKVKNEPTIIALVLGVLGLLIFGTGMTMILEWGLMLLGIVVALIGVLPIIVAYPIYKKVLGKNMDKYGDEIVKLTDQLLSEQQP
ncbi:MAG: hypothetical protein IJX16_02095 [Clostridia bacterium]|nr:hypothetical protein [Clostridia bacterium]